MYVETRNVPESELKIPQIHTLYLAGTLSGQVKPFGEKTGVQVIHTSDYYDCTLPPQTPIHDLSLQKYIAETRELHPIIAGQARYAAHMADSEHVCTLVGHSQGGITAAEAFLQCLSPRYLVLIATPYQRTDIELFAAFSYETMYALLHRPHKMQELTTFVQKIIHSLTHSNTYSDVHAQQPTLIEQLREVNSCSMAELLLLNQLLITQAQNRLDDLAEEGINKSNLKTTLRLSHLARRQMFMVHMNNDTLFPIKYKYGLRNVHHVVIDGHHSEASWNIPFSFMHT